MYNRYKQYSHEAACTAGLNTGWAACCLAVELLGLGSACWALGLELGLVGGGAVLAGNEDLVPGGLQQQQQQEQPVSGGAASVAGVQCCCCGCWHASEELNSTGW
jgi:hypothetical protein